jgi:hypothetical protein
MEEIIIITMCIGVVFYWVTVIIDDFKTNKIL